MKEKMNQNIEEENDMMEFVPPEDAIPEIPEAGAAAEPEKPKKKRRNFFRWCWDGVKWTFRKVRDSPAATLIGGLGGSALTLGGVALYEGRKARRYATLEIEDSGETTEQPMIEGETEEKLNDIDIESIGPTEDDVEETV